MREIDARGMRERCSLLCLIVVGGAGHALATSGGYLISCVSSYLFFTWTLRLPKLGRLAILSSLVIMAGTQHENVLAALMFCMPTLHETQDFSLLLWLFSWTVDSV